MAQVKIDEAVLVMKELAGKADCEPQKFQAKTVQNVGLRLEEAGSWLTHVGGRLREHANEVPVDGEVELNMRVLVVPTTEEIEQAMAAIAFLLNELP